MRRLVLTCVLLALPLAAAHAQDTTTYTHADSLRGADGPARAWWDVTFYDLHVRVDPTDSSVVGYNGITYRVLRPAREMQLDLQAPLVLDSVVQRNRRLTWRRDGDAYFVATVAPQRAGTSHTLTAYYHGHPGRGRTGAYSAGFVWSHDSLGASWFATSDEGPGASIWWPLKDYLGDEPDSQRIAVTVPDPMVEVSNGRLRSTTHHADGTTTYEWFVDDPINTYGVAVNAGDYTHFADTLQGVDGPLTLDFWPLAFHRDTAKVQWQQAKTMLHCFEHWFGPYPWYKDGYKLIETPYLGMEHQSGIAYGNEYKDGYLGRDLSRTGLGLTWDYIVVHESAHEWFGNNITASDDADMWVHEAFATYAEGQYVECRSGPLAGAAYIIGLRKGVQNTRPIVGPRGVRAWSGNDMYFKGANMLLTIRQLVDDDAKWRDILRGLNHTFWHQTVTGQQVQDYIGHAAGMDLRKVFEQYLTTTEVPELDYKVEHGTLSYRWTHVVPGFTMPVRVQIPGLGTHMLHPTETWQTLATPDPEASQLAVDERFYVTARNLLAPAADSTRSQR